MATINLGMVTAYAYAVAGGYTGTEAQFETLLGDIATTLNEFENFSVTVTTLPAGSSATASYNNGVLSLGIPKGDKGDKGDTGDTGATGATGATPDFSIGTVATGAVGSDAAATITGTAENPVLNLTLPRGATGDVTNLASTFSSATAYSAGDYVIYNDLLYVFTADHAAGAWSGSDAEQVTVGEELSSLKDDIYPLANRTYHPIIGGRIYNGISAGSVVDITPQASASYAYLVAKVEKNDIFIITGTGNTAYRPVCFTDTDYKVVSNSGTSYTNEQVTAPSNGYLVCTFDIEDDYSVARIGEHEEFAEDIETRVAYVESLLNKKYTSAQYTDDSTITTGYGTGTSGAGTQIDSTPVSNAGWSHIVIPCSKDDIFRITGTGGSSSRAWAFADSDYKLVENSTSYLTLTNDIVVSPTDGYLIANADSSDPHYITYIRSGLPDVVYVKPNATATETVFNTIVDAVDYANKQQNTTIYVESGTYDIIDELGGNTYTENLSGTSSYAGGIKLGNGTKIIGLGNGVKLTANYTAATNQVMTDRFSIFNIVGSFRLENLEFEVTNVRYCVHEDMVALTASERPDYYTGEYINCTMTHNGSSSSTYNVPACIGGGTMNNSFHRIEGCVLTSPSGVNPCGYHNNATTNNGVARVIMKDSYITNNGSIALTVYNSNTQVINAEINNNKLGASIVNNSSGLYNVKEWNNVTS